MAVGSVEKNVGGQRHHAFFMVRHSRVWILGTPTQLSSIFNSMLNTNSDTLRRVVQANLNLQPHSSACWTAQLLSAF